MCGICGVWGERNERRVGAMIDALRHRGPDDFGVLGEDAATIGMARLAIIDTTAGGHQPMSTPDGLISIVYNGETYNFRSEREILESKGVAFVSSSDTEVVLRMYEAYGDDFLTRLRGMFAVAIVDKRRGPGKEKLLLARDHFGIKPLLYAHAGGKLVFASEMKSILASGLVAPEIDPEGLRLLLTFGSVYQPATMIKGVRMLLPAHRLIIEDGRERIERFWSLGIDRVAGLRSLPPAEATAEIARVLEESVRMQLVSDVPLGAFLSGGIDSSLIVAMMAKSAGERLKTYSIGFGAEGSSIDESDDAEETARFIGTDHSRITVTADEVRDHISRIAFGLDQPSVDGVNTYFVSMAARRGVTVAISGTGGDELFAGYPSFIFMKRDLERERSSPFSSYARAAAARLTRSAVFDPLIAGQTGPALHKARNLSGFAARYANTWQVFGGLGAARLLDPCLRSSANLGRALHFDVDPIDELPNGSVIERTSALSIRGYLANQLLRDADTTSMIHSLEVRVPYLDPVVADAALSLPDDAKLGEVRNLENEYFQSYRDSGAKKILLDVGRGLLPPDFDTKPKRGFGMPFDAWLRGSLKDVLFDTLSDASVRRRGLFEPEAMRIFRESCLGPDVPWTQPWVLMMTELWCREVIDRLPESLG